MFQKVLKIGTSIAVIIPKRYAKMLGIKVGDKVNVKIDRTRRRLVITPLK